MSDPPSCEPWWGQPDSSQRKVYNMWYDIEQEMHLDFVRNPLMAALKSLTLNTAVHAHSLPKIRKTRSVEKIPVGLNPTILLHNMRIEISVPSLGKFHLEVEFWSEAWLQSQLGQVSAVTHTPETAQAGQLVVPEIMRHRVEGRGLVIVRASSGRTLRHGSKGSAELKTEAGMKRFFACMLMALDDMSTLPAATGEANLLRDIKPSSIVKSSLPLQPLSCHGSKPGKLPIYQLKARSTLSPQSDQFLAESSFSMDLGDRIFTPLPGSGKGFDFRANHLLEPLATASMSHNQQDIFMVGLTALQLLLGPGMPAPNPPKAKHILDSMLARSLLKCNARGIPNSEVAEHLAQAKEAADAEQHYLTSCQAFMTDLPGIAHQMAQAGMSKEAIDFMLNLVSINPAERPTPREAMKHAWVAPAVAELHQELRGNMQHYEQEMERHRQFSAAVLQEQALMNGIMVPKRALPVTTASGTAPECENIPQQCRMDASHAKVQESLQMEQQQEPQQDAAPSMHKQLPIEAYNAADLKKMKLLRFAACSATAALNRRLNTRVKILADQLKTADAIHESRGLRMKNMQQEIAALGQELVEAKQTLLWQQQQEEYKAHNARLAALKAQHKAEIQHMSVALAEIKAAKQAKIEVFSVDLADASTGKQTALLQMQAAQESGAATVELHEARQDVQLHGQQASVGKETYNAKLGALTVQTQAQDVQPCGELAAPNAAKELALSWYQLQAKQQQVEAVAQQLGETRLQQQQCQQLDAEHKGSDCHDVTSDADPALVADSAAANGEHVSFNRPVNLNAASSSTNSSCSVAEPDTPAAAQPEQPLEEEQVQQSQASTEDSDSDAGICGSKISSLQTSSNRSTSQHNQAEVTARLATNDVRKTHNNILVRTACRLLSRFRGKQLNKPVHNISSTSAVINVLNLSEEEEQQQQQPQAASDQHVSTALIIIDNDAGVVDDCNNSLLDSSLTQSSPALSSLPVSDTGNDDNAGDDCIRPGTADSINSSNSLCDDQTLAVMNSKINGNLLKRAAHRLLGLVKRKQLHHSEKAVKNAILAASNNPLAALGTGSDATIERLQLPVVLSSMATSGSVNKRTGPCGGLHYHMKLRMMRASSKRRHLAGAAVELHLSNHW